MIVAASFGSISTMEDVPIFMLSQDAFTHICTFLAQSDVLSCVKTCKLWKEFSDDDLFVSASLLMLSNISLEFSGSCCAATVQ